MLQDPPWPCRLRDLIRLAQPRVNPSPQHEIHMIPAHKTWNLLICSRNCQECFKHVSSNQLKHSIQTKHISQVANGKLVGDHVFKKRVLGNYLHKALKLNELSWITFFSTEKFGSLLQRLTSGFHFSWLFKALASPLAVISHKCLFFRGQWACPFIERLCTYLFQSYSFHSGKF